jgi:hypothetical protein
MFLENNTEMFWLFYFLLSPIVPVGCHLNTPSTRTGLERRENIKWAKGTEYRQYKTADTIFSSSLPICPVYFHLVMPTHVLSSCYTRYEHIRDVKWYVTYYLACHVRLQVPKQAILYEVVSPNHALVSLEKIWMGQMGRLEGKNKSTTFVLTAFISFGLFNIFQDGSQPPTVPEFAAGFVV